MKYLHLYKTFEPKLLAVCTTRKGGVSKGSYASMNLCHYVGDDPENVVTNKQLFCQAFDINPQKLFFPHQTHGNEVVTINRTLIR